MNEVSVARVLYIESDPDLLTLVLPAVQSSEYSVEIVDSGHKAIDAFEENPFDLILINQTLTDMTGLACMQLLVDKHPGLAAFVLLKEDQTEFIPQICEALLTNYLILDEGQLFIQQISVVLSNLLARQKLLRKLKETEQSLERQTEYMKAVFDYAPVEIYLKGTDRGYLWVNKQWQLHYNKSNEEAIALTSHDILPVKTANISRSNDEKVLASGLPTEESQIVETTIGVRSLRTIRFPVKNSVDKVTAIGVIALDDTEKRQNEAVLKSIFEDAPIGIVLHAPDGDTRVRVNHAFCNLVGYSRKELLQASYDKLTYHEDLDKSLSLRQELYDGKQDTISFEKRYAHKNGHVVWGNVSSFVIRGDGNKVLYFVSYIQDITSRKKSEREMALLGQAVEAATDALVIVEAKYPSMPIISINSAFTRMTGYPENECLGRNCIFLNGSDKQQITVDEINDAFKTEQSVHVLLRNYKRNGDMFWNDIHLDPIRSDLGVVTHFVASMRDVTEERYGHEELESSQRRLSLATEGVGIGIWEWTAATNDSWWDNRNCELYGIAPENFSNNFGFWAKRVHPEDIGRLRKELSMSLAGEAKFDSQYRIFLPDGEMRTLRGRAFVSRDKNGEPVRMVGINWDITDHVLLEDQIRQSQKMDAVGQLTGGIAHDFNNILGIVLGHLELIEDQVADNSNISKLLKTAIHGVERGANITKKLLAFSNKKAMGRVTVQLNDIIKNMQDLLATSLTVSINVVFDLTDNLWSVDIDLGDFEDAILNLSLNARDAMPNGGTLTIKTANIAASEVPTPVTLTKTSDPYVLISVSDTGTGMSEEVKEKLFDPFFTTKGPGKGTGLGLSMVFGFVQRSRGFITHQSEQGTGTSIDIYLPRGKGSIPLAGLSARNKSDLQRGDEIILVVDDEKDLADLAIHHLSELGYTTHRASNGEEALVILINNPDIQLLFSDVVMPGKLDGYQLSQEARQINPRLKILLTSGFTSRKERSSTIDMKTFSKLTENLLAKPYNRKDIAQTVRKTLDEN